MTLMYHPSKTFSHRPATPPSTIYRHLTIPDRQTPSVRIVQCFLG